MTPEYAYWRFHDLKRLGIVTNRMTLWRWIKNQGFPPGILLGPNSRAWATKDVRKWLETRKSGGSARQDNDPANNPLAVLGSKR